MSTVLKSTPGCKSIGAVVGHMAIANTNSKPVKENTKGSSSSRSYPCRKELLALIKAIAKPLELRLPHLNVIERMLFFLPEEKLWNSLGKINPIYARNMTLAKKADMPESTFRRVLSELKSKGFIVAQTPLNGRRSHSKASPDCPALIHGISLQPIFDRLPEFYEIDASQKLDRQEAVTINIRLKHEVRVLAHHLYELKLSSPLAKELEVRRSKIARRLRNEYDLAKIRGLETEIDQLAETVRTYLASLKMSAPVARFERHIQDSNQSPNKRNLDIQHDGSRTDSSMVKLQKTLHNEYCSFDYISIDKNAPDECSVKQVHGVNSKVLREGPDAGSPLTHADGSTPTLDIPRRGTQADKNRDLEWQIVLTHCDWIHEFLSYPISSYDDFRRCVESFLSFSKIGNSDWQRLLKCLGFTGASVVLFYVVQRGNSVGDPPSYFRTMAAKAQQGTVDLKRLLGSIKHTQKPRC